MRSEQLRWRKVNRPPPHARFGRFDFFDLAASAVWLIDDEKAIRARGYREREGGGEDVATLVDLNGVRTGTEKLDVAAQVIVPVLYTYHRPASEQNREDHGGRNLDATRG